MLLVYIRSCANLVLFNSGFLYLQLKGLPNQNTLASDTALFATYL